MKRLGGKAITWRATAHSAGAYNHLATGTGPQLAIIYASNLLPPFVLSHRQCPHRTCERIGLVSRHGGDSALGFGEKESRRNTTASNVARPQMSHASQNRVHAVIVCSGATTPYNARTHSPEGNWMLHSAWVPIPVLGSGEAGTMLGGQFNIQLSRKGGHLVAN